MPLLIHLAGWWLIGLFVGAWLGDASRAAGFTRSVGAATVPWVVVLLLLVVLVVRRARCGRDTTLVPAAAFGSIGKSVV